MTNEFDTALKKQGWNIWPEERFSIPSSTDPLLNAARAIAVSAYPKPQQHYRGGKAEKYSVALLAEIYRILKQSGRLKKLPAWTTEFRVASMERHLNSGYRNPMRAFTIRNLINSAAIMKQQHEQHLRGEKATFTIQYSPDLLSLTIDIPIEKSVSGYILSGRIPDTKLASLRAAILYHRSALSRFEGPAKKKDGHDPEIDYQNAYTRYVRPALFSQHIVQLVWEQANRYLEEANRSELPIDQVLMRKADWASDIHLKTLERMGPAIHQMKELGVPSCWCKMVRFASPLPDS